MRQYQNYRHGDLISLSTAENVSMEAITDPQDLSTIGGRFKARRIELGLGQTDVAVAAGIKQPSYSAIETNDTKEITAKVFAALCMTLGIAWEYAMYGKGDHSEQDAQAPSGLFYAHCIGISYRLAWINRKILMRPYRHAY